MKGSALGFGTKNSSSDLIMMLQSNDIPNGPSPLEGIKEEAYFSKGGVLAHTLNHI